MKKNIKVEKILHTTRQAIEGGMVVYGNFLFGMPGETKQTIKDTMKFMLELEKMFVWQKKDFKQNAVPYASTSSYNYSILIPLPTSEVFDKAISEGLIADMDWYLSYLDVEEHTQEYLKSHLRHIGGATNLSDFAFKEALVCYVKFAMSAVKLVAITYEDVKLTTKVKNVVVISIKCALLYAKYVFAGLASFKERSEIGNLKVKNRLALSLMNKKNRELEEAKI